MNHQRSVPVRVLDVDVVVLGEHDESEMRKDFTPSERVEIGKRIEAALSGRKGSNQRTAKELPQNFADAAGKETREIAARKAGFGPSRHSAGRTRRRRSHGQGRSVHFGCGGSLKGGRSVTRAEIGKSTA